MNNRTDIDMAPQEIAPLLGDPHPLVEQVGSTAGLLKSAVAPKEMVVGHIDSLPALRAFVESYRTGLLVPVELPAILAAQGHAVRHEVLELIGLDQRLASDPRLKPYAAASCRVGQRQLHRLRPLRDHRLLQRYLAAVDGGQAHGWHMLAFGVALGVFSLALRQGLAAYARHTVGGFIESAARRLNLSENACRDLLEELSAPLPENVNRLLQPQGREPLRLV
jgi:urease accessory protein UreF